MSGTTQATKRGTKHRCGSCGAAFYDLERELTACPKCGTPYEAAAQVPRGQSPRKRQSWNKRARPEPEGAPEAPAAEAGEDDAEEGVPILDAADDTDEAGETEQADEENGAAADDDA